MLSNRFLTLEAHFKNNGLRKEMILKRPRSTSSSHWLSLSGLLALLFFVFPSHAQAAYLDPGTGSMILQSVLAALLGAAFIIRTQWKKFKALFGKKEIDQNGQETQNDETQD